MTFNLFGGFKFAAPASHAACNTGSGFGTPGHDAFGGGLFGGGLFGGGHGGFDKLLGHHDDDHHDAHASHDTAPCTPDHSDSTPAASNNFPAIPSDTLGVTFSIDLDGDGVNDEYAVVKAVDNPTAQDQTLQHYYDQVAADLSASHPDLAANQIVVKATIYSASQGESYYHFTGDETTTEEQNAENDQDHHDDPDYDHNHQHVHDNEQASEDHGSSCDSSDGDHHAEFYSGLMSCKAGSHDDKEPVPEHEDDAQEEHHHDFHFC
jgi:hypothetical protein